MASYYVISQVLAKRWESSMPQYAEYQWNTIALRVGDFVQLVACSSATNGVCKSVDCPTCQGWLELRLGDEIGWVPAWLVNIGCIRYEQCQQVQQVGLCIFTLACNFHLAQVQQMFKELEAQFQCNFNGPTPTIELLSQGHQLRTLIELLMKDQHQIGVLIQTQQQEMKTMHQRLVDVLNDQRRVCSIAL